MRIFLAFSFIISLCLNALEGVGQGGYEPKTFDQFYDSQKMSQTDGHFTIYQSGNSYFLEIPEADLGKDILITTQTVVGYDSSVSPSSGVVQFRKGRNNGLEMFRNKSNTFSADSSDYWMEKAIQKSGLVASERVFTVAAWGKDKKSVIIDITSDLNSPSGLFDLTGSGNLNSPDPSRSWVQGFRLIDGGVVFSAIRSQTQYFQSSTGTTSGGKATSFQIEMLIQRVPDHEVEIKKDHPAYGFETVQHIEYDTDSYRANTVNMIKRWSLTASAKDRELQKKGVAVVPKMPIQVWIDSIMPGVYQESVKTALKQWEYAFEQAGWKNVFQFVDDGALGYKKIDFYWGNAYSNNTNKLICDEVTGEILAARVNLMDEVAKNTQPNYVMWFGSFDPRVKTNKQPLKIRQQILTSQMAGMVGELLGMKANYPAVTAFSPEQLRDANWLQKYGPTATVVGATTADYLVQPEDHIDPALLFPKVSVYDIEAIAYAYGSRNESPSLKATFYAGSDNIDPYAQSTFLSNDLVEASKLGLKNLERVYPQIPVIVAGWPAYQNTPEEIAALAKQAFSVYQFYINQVAMCVGGRSKRKVIRGENEVPVRYVPKNKQEEALELLAKCAFSGLPAWFDNDEINRVLPVSFDGNGVNMANSVMQNLMRKEVLWSLVEAEKELGDQAYTCSDLFSYFDRVFFNNYDPKSTFNAVQMNIQYEFVVNLLTTVNQNNITGGLNDVSSALNVYLVQVRDHLEKLLEYKKLEPTVRSNFELMLLKMNREYFGKTV
ncbi:zinc-dependent metalloprotease [Mangrovibacterium lignilyticum]|uniref:zinc-dependent metalloprotease n=1 Tax=Mangrovibacterium lignilyticum TaxID=2668052 RepID=UPI0013D0A0F6|nr:zinc-dependent metalloprotease [Mangrovibacterium lignilyticum]